MPDFWKSGFQAFRQVRSGAGRGTSGGPLARPQPKPAMTKAPRKVHPYAPDGVAPDVVVVPDPPGPESGSATKMFSTRLRPDLVRRLKVYAASEGVPVQDVVTAALVRYLPDGDSD